VTSLFPSHRAKNSSGPCCCSFLSLGLSSVFRLYREWVYGSDRRWKLFRRFGLFLFHVQPDRGIDEFLHLFFFRGAGIALWRTVATITTIAAATRPAAARPTATTHGWSIVRISARAVSLLDSAVGIVALVFVQLPITCKGLPRSNLHALRYGRRCIFWGGWLGEAAGRADPGPIVRTRLSPRPDLYRWLGLFCPSTTWLHLKLKLAAYPPRHSYRAEVGSRRKPILPYPCDSRRR
jgi:hypothetical protein